MSAFATVAFAAAPALADNPRVKLETTLGDIVVELDAEKAPISTVNFLQYTQDEFYDGTIFHRVMPDFMIQGGGLLPNLEKKSEGLRDPIKNEWKNGLKNVRGSIAMARTSQADSATAQFFINVVDNPALDQATRRGDNAAYAVFGEVVEGMDVVDKIRFTETKEDAKYPGGKVVPATPVVIESASVVGEFSDEDLNELIAKLKAEKKAAADAKAAEIAKSQAAGRNFLEENKTKEGVKTTESGLQYKILKEGEGASPNATSTVVAHYEGKLIDGTVFDSSFERGQPATFPLNRVIKGWTEGLQKIAPGGEIELYIPSELGYGARGAQGVIPPHATLIFRVQLLSMQ